MKNELDELWKENGSLKKEIATLKRRNTRLETKWIKASEAQDELEHIRRSKEHDESMAYHKRINGW